MAAGCVINCASSEVSTSHRQWVFEQEEAFPQLLKISDESRVTTIDLPIIFFLLYLNKLVYMSLNTTEQLRGS